MNEPVWKPLLDEIQESIQNINDRLSALVGEPTFSVRAYETYDINVYVGDYDKLSISAYERTAPDESGYVSTNTNRYQTFTVPMSINNAVLVAELLKSPYWTDLGWVDYDAWESSEFILQAIDRALDVSVVPADAVAPKLLSWLDSLPAYTAQ